MLDISRMQWVLGTLAVLLSMALICILCCMSIKYSDIRMRCYILETAKKRGIRVDPRKWQAKTCSELVGEDIYTFQPHLANCSIIVPDVGIIV